MDWAALFLNERVIAALVTALVGGGVVAAGWVITHLLSRARDRALREERIADIQRALLAEIRAHVFALEEQQAAREMPALKTVTDEDYLPILPHDANDRMFRAIVEEVHLLPEWAIDPVVRYYRLLAVRAALAQDIRSNAKEYPRRAAQMFHDYLEITEETWDTGLEAVEILTASLRGDLGCPTVRPRSRRCCSAERTMSSARSLPICRANWTNYGPGLISDPWTGATADGRQPYGISDFIHPTPRRFRFRTGGFRHLAIVTPGPRRARRGVLRQLAAFGGGFRHDQTSSRGGICAACCR